MKLLFPAIALLSITSCQSMHSSDPDSMFFSIPAGSTLTLNDDLEITKLNTHALIQAGKVTTENKKSEYDINCRLEFKEFGPRTIKPEIFHIRRTEDGSQWVSRPNIMRFYTEVYLTSEKDTDVIKMECQTWGDGIDRNFTVTEMAEALGQLLSFKFVDKK